MKETFRKKRERLFFSREFHFSILKRGRTAWAISDWQETWGASEVRSPYGSRNAPARQASGHVEASPLWRAAEIPPCSQWKQEELKWRSIGVRSVWHGGACPRASMALLPEHSPEVVGRDEVHPRSAHRSRRARNNTFCRFSSSLPNTWATSLPLGPVHRWQDQEEQECSRTPAPKQGQHGVSAGSCCCHGRSLSPPPPPAPWRKCRGARNKCGFVWFSGFETAPGNVARRQTRAFKKSWLWPTVSAEPCRAEGPGSG